MIRVELPFHLRNLAGIAVDEVASDGCVELDVEEPVTLRAVVDQLEATYPTLRGAIRDHGVQERRPLVRFFASQRDLSHESMDTVLPDAVASGDEPLLVVGALAGG